MKKLFEVTKLWVLFCACYASSWQASAGPIIGGREWYQPADLLGYSWNDFNAICNGGTCNGLLGGAGPNLTGWTWASIYEVGDLFAATSPHTGGISRYQTPLGLPANNFFASTGFLPTSDLNMAINFGIQGVAGLSSTLAPTSGNAYFAFAQLGIFPGNTAFGSTFATDGLFPLSEASSTVGGWLYRAAEVPAPATVWLVALGVVALRWSRCRPA